eukprot:114034_1
MKEFKQEEQKKQQTLLTQSYTKLKEKKVRLLGYATTKISLDLLIIGYLHCYIDEYSHTYPFEIMYVIRRFYDDARCLTFDICKMQYRKCVKHWGSVIERGVYNNVSQKPSKILFGSPLGITEGIHKWKIKIKQSTDATIGIVLNETLGVFSISRVWGPKYYIHAQEVSINGVIIYGGDTQRKRISMKKWKKDTIIAFCLNCHLWTFTISIEKTNVSEKLSVAKNRKYYPFIQSEANNSKYLLVGYEC